MVVPYPFRRTVATEITLATGVAENARAQLDHTDKRATEIYVTRPVEVHDNTATLARIGGLSRVAFVSEVESTDEFGEQPTL